MPIYEYRCQRCSLTFEVKRGFEDGAKVACPKCGGGEVKQKYYPAPIFFKGGGFSTTYRG